MSAMNFWVASARSRDRCSGVCGMLGSVAVVLLAVGGGGRPARVRWWAVTASGIWWEVSGEGAREGWGAGVRLGRIRPSFLGILVGSCLFGWVCAGREVGRGRRAGCCCCRSLRRRGLAQARRSCRGPCRGLREGLRYLRRWGFGGRGRGLGLMRRRWGRTW